MELEDLVLDEGLQLQKLQELVQNSLKEEQFLSERLAVIEEDTNISLGQRLADHVADIGGSWYFILSFGLFLVLWIAVNVAMLRKPFDPFPFILLNLLLSCLAAVQAPIIMMSQNRQEDKDRTRARNDFLINLKAEMEVRNLHEKIDLLIAEQMHSLFKAQEAQLELLKKIEAKLK